MLYFPNSFPPFGYFLFAKEEESFKRQRRGESSKKSTRYNIPNSFPCGYFLFAKEEEFLSDNVAEGVKKQHVGELGFLFYTILYKHRRPGNCPADG